MIQTVNLDYLGSNTASAPYKLWVNLGKLLNLYVSSSIRKDDTISTYIIGVLYGLNVLSSY